tara:strand:+ start:693 stop:1010 length:318 start_codon:yes stop_codon:yes gene_type:complete
MDYSKIDTLTTTIISSLDLHKYHQPRATLQVWYVLRNSFRYIGVPRTEDEIRDVAIRCVDMLVGDTIIKDCTDTNDQDEFEAQDSIVEVLEEMLPKLGHNLSFTK